MPCIKEVGNLKCQYCKSETIKFGMRPTRQRYRRKQCGKIQLCAYKLSDCGPLKRRLLYPQKSAIVAYFNNHGDQEDIKDSRFYQTDPHIHRRRIQTLGIENLYRTKTNNYWVIYALERVSKKVVDIKVGNRNKKNLLEACLKIYFQYPAEYVECESRKWPIII
jgi:hypothetical protein